MNINPTKTEWLRTEYKNIILKTAKRILMFFVFFSAVFGVVYGDELRYINLPECISIALKNNLAVNAARQEIIATDNHVKENMLAWYPSIGLLVEPNRYKKEPSKDVKAGSETEIVPGVKIPAGLLSSAGLEYYKFNFSLAANQLIFDAKTLAKIKISVVDREIAITELLSTKQSVALQVSENYYKLLELEKAANLAEKKFLYQREILEVTRRRADKGETGELAVLQAEIELEQAKNEKAHLKDELLQAKNRLFNLIGIKFSSDILIENEIKIYSHYNDLQVMLEKLQQKNTEIKKAEYQIAKKEYEVALSISGNKPYVSMYGDYNTYKTATAFTDAFQAFDKSWIAGIKMYWPFYDSGMTEKATKAAKADLRKTEIDYKKVKEKLIEELTRLYQDFKRGKDNLSLLKKRKELATKKLEIAEKFYAMNKISYNDLSAKKIELEETIFEETKAILRQNILEMKIRSILAEDIFNEN